MPFSAPTAIGALYLSTTPLLLPILAFIGVVIRIISESKKEVLVNVGVVLLVFLLLFVSIFGVANIFSPVFAVIIICITLGLHILLLFISFPKVFPVMIATLTLLLFFSVPIVPYYNVIILIPLAAIVYSIGYLLPQSSLNKIRIHQAAGLMFLMIPFLSFSFMSYMFFDSSILELSSYRTNTIGETFIPLGVLFFIALILLFIPNVKRSLYQIGFFENIILGGVSLITALFLFVTSTYLQLTGFDPLSPCATQTQDSPCVLNPQETPLIVEFLAPYFLVFANIVAIGLPLSMIFRGVQNGEAWIRNLGVSFLSILLLGHVSFMMTDVITSTAIAPSALVTGIVGIVILSFIYYGNTRQWLSITKSSENSSENIK